LLYLKEEQREMGRRERVNLRDLAYGKTFKTKRSKSGFC
jgi:hypothetical protein